MSWDLIRSIQKDTDLRLILPFGLNVHIGDVIGVQRDGNFTLEGSSASLLGISPGTPRTGIGVDLAKQSGKNTSMTFRAAGEASTLFPQLPTANAGFDVSFGAANEWVLAVVGRRIASLTEVNRFREPILRAYRRGVWKADWALVIELSTVNRLTVIASRSADTKLSLAIDANVATSTATEAKLTAGVSIVRTNHDVISCITSEPGPAFCAAMRVRSHWFRPEDVGMLAVADEELESSRSAADEKFWEDVDELR